MRATIAANPQPVTGATVALLLTAADAVPAGFPSPAMDYYDGPLDLNDELVRDRTSTYVLRVSGHSMQGAGIWDGDRIIVDRSIEPRDGAIVVAVLDGEFTVKRLRRTSRGVVLQAENAEYPDITVPSLSELTIWGTVTYCLHHAV